MLKKIIEFYKSCDKDARMSICLGPVLVCIAAITATGLNIYAALNGVAVTDAIIETIAVWLIASPAIAVLVCLVKQEHKLHDEE